MHLQEPDAGSYQGTVMDHWTECMPDLTNATKSAKHDVKPPPSLNASQWLDFLTQHCNPTTGMPLTYILCESVDVPVEDLAKSYPTINDNLIVTTMHSGHQFCINNQCVFVLYKQLIIDGPAWHMQSPCKDQGWI